ncbi:hypothetical protein GCM10010251_26250 [Streptomyces aurantiogriseus]|uniref:Trypsin-co-occurring domain-containing protein n=1 Tax=Streptomyces aurantiogriseus TaxID=66870 RepID=A0A918C6K0_9ACTN|nr:hypothetical protein GCM10010251_26250 [Streptomyces aurantiogriseus]
MLSAEALTRPRIAVSSGTLDEGGSGEGAGVEQVDGTELSEAVKAVRAGLAAAQQEGADSAIRFTVKEIVLDLGIEIRRTASAGGGVKAFVVSGEARGERAGTATHRMTVTLEVAEGGAAVAGTGAGRQVLIGDQGQVGDLPGGRAFQ